MASAWSDGGVGESESLRRVYVDLGLTKAEKTVVVGAGSLNGVDAERYHNDEQARKQAQNVRKLLGIPSGAPLIGRSRPFFILWTGVARP